MKKYIYSLLVLAMTAFTFSSCEDVPAPYDLPNKPETPETPGVATGTGTADDPFNSIAAIAYCQSLEAGVESENEVYIKGKVQSIKEEFGSYGNGSFYIADDENSTTFYVYRTLYLGNKKWTSSDEQIKVGDEVVVCGKVVNYSGNTPETVQNKAYLVSLNGKTAGGDTPATGEAKGTGTQADPFNSVAAQKYTAALEAGKVTDQEFYIKGKIQKFANNGEFNAQYGNASFYIADDANSEQFYIFRTYYFGGEKWKEGDGQLKVGDEVVVCAKLINYMGNTPETNQGGKLITVNGKTSIEGGGSETPDTPATGDGISINGLTVTLTNSAVTAGESIKVEDISTLSPAANPESITLSDGTVLTFDANGSKTKPAFNSNYNELRLYANNKMTITASKNIAKIILTCSVYNGVNEVGNETATVAFSGKTATYTNVFTGTSGGGVQLRIKSIEIVYAK